MYVRRKCETNTSADSIRKALSPPMPPLFEGRRGAVLTCFVIFVTPFIIFRIAISMFYTSVFDGLFSYD